MLRCGIFDPAMTEMGQNPKLPHRNIDGRFTSISRHQRHDGGRGHRQHEHEYGDESDAKLSDCSKARSRPSQLGRIASATTASSGAKPSRSGSSRAHQRPAAKSALGTLPTSACVRLSLTVPYSRNSTKVCTTDCRNFERESDVNLRSLAFSRASCPILLGTKSNSTQSRCKEFAHPPAPPCSDPFPHAGAS